MKGEKRKSGPCVIFCIPLEESLDTPAEYLCMYSISI